MTRARHVTWLVPIATRAALAFVALGMGACSFQVAASSDAAIQTDPDGPPIHVLGAIARWELDEGAGTIVRDTSGVGEPLDLEIDDPANVTWMSGALVITAPVRIRSQAVATKLNQVAMTTNQLSVELWIKPANATQDGPARVFSLSSNQHLRNVMLGQLGAQWVYRLRTPSTGANGLPNLTSPSAIADDPALVHLVVTHDGEWRWIYRNGIEFATDQRGGSLAGWDPQFHVILANEDGDDRPWLGELHRVVAYNHRLSPDEIAALHELGP